MRYGNYMSGYAGAGRKAAATFGASYSRAAAAAIPRALPPLPISPFRFPQVPPPPLPLVAGLGVALLVGGAVGVATKDDTPANGSWNPDGTFRWFGQYRSSTSKGALPASMCANSITTNSPNCSGNWRRFYSGGASCSSVTSATTHTPVMTWPPGCYYEDDFKINRPQLLPPGSVVDPSDAPIARPSDWAEHGTRARPAVRHGARIGDIAVATTDTTGQAIHVAPTYPIHEGKHWASTQMVKFINTWFGAGGEAIDLMRCLLFATGHTYKDASGKERVIPRSQWGEVYGTERVRWAQNKSVRVDGAEAMSNRFLEPKRDRRDAYGNVLTPRAMGTRAAECLFMNWLTDGLIAAHGRSAAAMARDIRINLGPLGVESQIGMMRGDPAYAGLLGSIGL